MILFSIGQFLINLIQTALFLLLNLFLKQGGLDDPEIAALGSKRFIATFLLAIPAGLWMRGKPLRWPLIAASIAFPASALAGLEAARLQRHDLAAIAFLAMGAAGLVLSVASLPMVMRAVAGCDAACDASLRRIFGNDLRFNMAVSALGVPVATTPIGYVDGAPIGVQLIGQRFREDVCLDVAAAIEARLGLPVHDLWAR